MVSRRRFAFICTIPHKLLKSRCQATERRYYGTRELGWCLLSESSTSFNSLERYTDNMSVYQFVVKARESNGSEYRNVHHYEFFNYVPDNAQLQEAVDGLDAIYKGWLQNVISNRVEFYGYDIRRVDVASLPVVPYSATAGAWTATNTNFILPHQCAALVSFNAQTGFPRRGRTYIFGCTAGDLASDGGVSASLQGILTSWSTDVLSLDITGGLDADKSAVKYSGNPPAVIDSNDLVQFTVSPIWATQRRRRKGVGI